jgi:hypothetical protein
MAAPRPNTTSASAFTKTNARSTNDRHLGLSSGLIILLALCHCGPSDLGPVHDTGLEGLGLAAVVPGELVPGSTLFVTGRSFVDQDFGVTVLHLVGTMGDAPVDVRLPLRFVDYMRLELAFGGGRAAGLPADAGTFRGDASVEVESTVDGRTYRSAALPVELSVATELVPSLRTLAGGPVIFVNEPLQVTGSGLLLGGGEGQTVAELTGCFIARGTPTCLPVGPTSVPVTPASAFDRSRGTFAFDPRIAGIEPGQFRGTVRLRNVGRGGAMTSSEAHVVDYTTVEPAIFSVAPAAASLGQYVDIRGGGFVGPELPGEPVTTTTIELDGTFTTSGEGGSPTAVRFSVVPSFVSGPLVRYVLNEDDALGRRLDLRRTAGTFQGTVRPIVSRGEVVVRGDASPASLGVAPVRQVVWLRFQPAYTESLRKFGLRAADAHIRARVLAVARRDFEGVNIDFRTEPPTDFALFSTVDIGGPDLNGLGYFGYDNTPGKDIGNRRLYDQIGGLNATTQEDGQPGYGGVFVESLFGFSMHPKGLAVRLDGATPLFDQIFDPFRPDVGGAPVLGRDLVGDLPPRTNGEGCPSGGARADKISCAVFVLGSMIGTTMTHEVGHSLGLAEPDGSSTQYHNPGDEPNRLMDGGSARTFAERAELAGEGPSLFCDEELAYLRNILPSSEPAPTVARPPCR